MLLPGLTPLRSNYDIDAEHVAMLISSTIVELLANNHRPTPPRPLLELRLQRLSRPHRTIAELPSSNAPTLPHTLVELNPPPSQTTRDCHKRNLGSSAQAPSTFLKVEFSVSDRQALKFPRPAFPHVEIRTKDIR